jgi:hypothetical protein
LIRLEKIVFGDEVTGIVGIWLIAHNIALKEVVFGKGILSIDDSTFNDTNNITIFKIYALTAPSTNFSLGGTPRPLHIKAGATGYNVSPWTNTTIFSSIIADL